MYLKHGVCGLESAIRKVINKIFVYIVNKNKKINSLKYLSVELYDIYDYVYKQKKESTPPISLVLVDNNFAEGAI